MKINRLLTSVLALAACQAFALTPVNIRVDGEGYLRLVKDGHVVFAREILLTRTNGKLGAEDGVRVLPEITVPDTVKAIQVSLDGTVTLEGPQGTWRAGRLVLGMFPATALLVGDGDYTVSADRAQLTYPGEGLAGVIETKGNSKPVLNATVTRTETPKTDPNKTQLPKPDSPKPLPAPKTPVTKHLRIELKSEVEMDGDTAFLKDLATITGPEADVAKASLIKVDNVPVVSVTRRIDSLRIRALVKLAGLDVVNTEIVGGPMINLRRVSQTVVSDQFLASAIAALKPLVGPSGTLTLVNENGADTIVPKGEMELKVSAKGLNGTRATATVEVWVDGRKITSRMLQFTVEGLQPKPKVGQNVRVISRIGGVKIETSGRVTRVNGAGEEFEVETVDKIKLIGVLAADGSIEVRN